VLAENVVRAGWVVLVEDVAQSRPSVEVEVGDLDLFRGRSWRFL
jgi:hypothetical protein